MNVTEVTYVLGLGEVVLKDVVGEHYEEGAEQGEHLECQVHLSLQGSEEGTEAGICIGGLLRESSSVLPEEHPHCHVRSNAE